MLVILKIPIVYLVAVVYWAIKAEPRPPEGAALLAVVDPEPGRPCPWIERRAHRARPRRPLRPGPVHGRRLRAAASV